MREFFKQNPISSPNNLNTFFLRYDKGYNRRVLSRGTRGGVNIY